MQDCLEGCGRTTDRPSGVCFGCHIKGITFNYVSGAGYGRSNFNKATISEHVAAIKHGAEIRGIEAVPVGNRWV